MGFDVLLLFLWAVDAKSTTSVCTRLDITWPSHAANEHDLTEFAGGFFWLNMPALSPLEWHPFSFSSAFPPSAVTGGTSDGKQLQQASEPYFSIHLQSVNRDGEWTTELPKLFQPSQHSTLSASMPVHTVANPDVQIRLYGPYANRDLDLFSPTARSMCRHIVLVGGGVGVTPCISVLDTYLKVRVLQCRTKLRSHFIMSFWGLFFISRSGV